VPFAKNDQVKEGETGRTCNTYGREEDSIEVFGGKTKNERDHQED
jgi:hypothetical protein